MVDDSIFTVIVHDSLCEIILHGLLVNIIDSDAGDKLPKLMLWLAILKPPLSAAVTVKLCPVRAVFPLYKPLVLMLIVGAANTFT